MGKKIISFLSDGILSGIFLCVGCCVSMSVESKPLGAFLFSLGLCAIIVFKFGLFTGKAGYMAVKPLSYVPEVVLTFIGNATGAAIGGFLLNLTRFGTTLSEKAAAITATKFADSPLSIFVLAVFCGILMFTAVDGNKRAAEKGDFVMSLFIVVLPVMVFILCGFNHCIADTCYFFISKCANASQAAVYFLWLYNAAGCMSVPMVKKLSFNKLFLKKFVIVHCFVYKQLCTNLSHFANFAKAITSSSVAFFFYCMFSIMALLFYHHNIKKSIFQNTKIIKKFFGIY